MARRARGIVNERTQNAKDFKYSPLYVIYTIIIFWIYVRHGNRGIDETNNIIIILTKIFAYMGLFMPVICFICYLVSKKTTENKSLSIIIKFLPILIFALMIILDFIIIYIR